MDKRVINLILEGKDEGDDRLSSREKIRYSQIENDKIVDLLDRKGIFGLEFKSLDTRTDRIEYTDRSGFESSMHLTNLGNRLENGIYVLNREESVNGGVLVR